MPTHTNKRVGIPTACQAGQQVSIINFSARGLRGEGLVYPLSDFTNWWQGTLNEAIADEFTIDGTGEYLVFLLQQRSIFSYLV